MRTTDVLHGWRRRPPSAPKKLHGGQPNSSRSRKSSTKKLPRRAPPSSSGLEPSLESRYLTLKDRHLKDLKHLKDLPKQLCPPDKESVDNLKDHPKQPCPPDKESVGKSWQKEKDKGKEKPKEP